MVVLAQSPGWNPVPVLWPYNCVLVSEICHCTEHLKGHSVLYTIRELPLWQDPQDNPVPAQAGWRAGVTHVWSPACQTLTLQGWPPGPEIPGVPGMGSGDRPQLLPNWISVHWVQNSQGPGG